MFKFFFFVDVKEMGRKTVTIGAQPDLQTCTSLPVEWAFNLIRRWWLLS